MSLRENQADLDLTLQRLSEVLGGTVRALNLDCETAGYLYRHLRREGSTGFGASQPIRTIQSGSRGHGVSFGIERFSVKIGDAMVPLARAINPFADEYGSPLNDVWACRTEHLTTLYRYLRRGVEEKHRQIKPVMKTDLKTRLWDNTVGFLERGSEAFDRFGVPLKRGVLLAGEPGNGKTMAARWLLNQASKLGFDWRTVRAEEYEMARNHGSARNLFELQRPGIIFFDDLDQALRNRDDVGSSGDHSTFLSELDGLSIRQGVVYLFTSNALFKQLDPAFRRPGRIDVFIRFEKPDAAMRRELIVDHWPKEIVESIPVDEAVSQTGGLSFAEVEELKKLLVMRYLDSREWEWNWAWDEFRKRGSDDKSDRFIGFAPRRNGHKPDGHQIVT